MKYFYIFPSLLLSMLFATAQENNGKWGSFSAGVSAYTYKGDVKQKFNLIGSPGFGGEISFEKRINSYIGAGVDFFSGKIAVNNISPSMISNFQTSFKSIQLQGTLYTDNGDWLPENNPMSLFVSTGLGIMFYAPYTDLKDENGEQYYYAKDGKIYNTPVISENSKELKRDYVYETAIKDTATVKTPTSTLQLPLTIGLKCHLSKRLELKTSTSLIILFTDYFDGMKSNGNQDVLASLTAQLSYNIFKNDFKKDKNAISNQELNQLLYEDSDSDGVLDINDQCPGTSAKVNVDAQGCPVDTDADGVPDYIDKEQNTPEGAIIDENGIALSDSLIYMRYLQQSDSIIITNKTISHYEISPQEQIKNIFQMMDDNTDWINQEHIHKSYPQEFLFMDKNKNKKIDLEEIKGEVTIIVKTKKIEDSAYITRFIQYFIQTP